MVALPYPHSDRDAHRFSAWVGAGGAASMTYLQRVTEDGRLVRARVHTPFPWARSAIVCFSSYANPSEPLSIDETGERHDSLTAGLEQPEISSKESIPQSGWVARYAWSSRIDPSGKRVPSDYHKVLLKRLKTLEEQLHQQFGEFESRAYVDTGPVVERSLAVAAGLGWTGKNTCLIHPTLGSFGFLAVLLTSLESAPKSKTPQVPDRQRGEQFNEPTGGTRGLQAPEKPLHNDGPSGPAEGHGLQPVHSPPLQVPGALAPAIAGESSALQFAEILRPNEPSNNRPASAGPPGLTSHPGASAPAVALPHPDRCGSCTRCIEACPTHALDTPYQMDASRCIAYLTIEHKGPIDHSLMPGIGRQLFGCDICQDVCPWNSKARRSSPIQIDPELAPRPELVNPTLEWLSSLDEPSFERLFNGSPVRRTGFNGLRRNIAVAIGNSGNSALTSKLLEWAESADEGLRHAAQWALTRLQNPRMQK